MIVIELEKGLYFGGITDDDVMITGSLRCKKFDTIEQADEYLKQAEKACEGDLSMAEIVEI